MDLNQGQFDSTSQSMCKVFGGIRVYPNNQASQERAQDITMEDLMKNN